MVVCRGGGGQEEDIDRSHPLKAFRVVALSPFAIPNAIPATLHALFGSPTQHYVCDSCPVSSGWVTPSGSPFNSDKVLSQRGGKYSSHRDQSETNPPSCHLLYFNSVSTRPALALFLPLLAMNTIQDKIDAVRGAIAKRPPFCSGVVNLDEKFSKLFYERPDKTGGYVPGFFQFNAV